MTQEHPITPPRYLVQSWLDRPACKDYFSTVKEVANAAAQWGADQELEACCEWLAANDWKSVHKHLRALRRPKPTSLKEQSIALVASIQRGDGPWSLNDLDVIRRALESLPE